MRKHKSILSLLLTVIFSFSLVLCKSSIAMAAPIIWDLYAENSGIDQTIYNAEQSTMNKYNDSYNLKPTPTDTLPHGASNAYTNLTIDPSTSSMSKWYVSGYGPYLDYATKHIGSAENISIDWNNLNNTYSNANYIYIGSNEADLAEAKSAAMMNYSSDSLLPILINSNSVSLSPAVTGAVDDNNINNLVILGGGQRFSDLIGIGDKYNMVRIGGVDRNDTYNLLSTVENGNKNGFYNPTQPTTDSNGVVCDIPDSAFKPTNILNIKSFLDNGDFNSAVSYVLSRSQGSTSNIQNFNYSALIGCQGKFLKVFYVNYKNNFSYGVYQYMGPTYFNSTPVNPPDNPPKDNKPPKVYINAPTSVVMGDDCKIEGWGEDPEGQKVSLKWSYSDILHDKLEGAGGTVWFSQPGNGFDSVTLTGTDPGGLSDSTNARIEIKPPIPQVIITAADNKVNHKVTIDMLSSRSSQSNGKSNQRYPIDFDKTVWELRPLDVGMSLDDIKTLVPYTITKNDDGLDVMRIEGNYKNIDILSKKQGKINVYCKLTNTAGYTGFTNYKVTIGPDLAPIADFSITKKAIRDPNNNNIATFNLIDASSSTDGDVIGKRVWLYAFDSNNDGNFDNETWYVYNSGAWKKVSDFTKGPGNYADLKNLDIESVNDGNLTSVQIQSSHVGKYKAELIVREGDNNSISNDPLLKAYVSTNDLLRSNTFDH